MILKKIKVIAALILIAFFAFNSNAQNNLSKRQIQLAVLLSHVDQFHFSEVEFDEKYADKVFDLYIKGLDGGKRFLLKQDVEALKKHKANLANAITETDFEMHDLGVELFLKRRSEAAEYYKKILAKPFDFELEESVQTNADKRDFAMDKAELKDIWRKILKWSTAAKILDLQETDEHKEKSFKQLEKLAREKVLKQNNDWYTRMEQDDDDDFTAIYLNAVTQAIDPHTSYFPPADKETFDITMSGKLEGIGARLQQEGAYTKVVAIIPGSPSSQQGELEADDIILKVAQADEEPVDVVDMPLDEVVKMIRGPKGTEVRLTVKKISGAKQIIPIVRDVVILEETYAKSAIIEEDDSKIGYIYLPSFYSDRDSDGRDCYKDVKAEIEKLNNENVDGLVFDLRNNTGGYLYSVVKMVGLFIENGPIVQVKSKDPEAKLHKDYDNKIQFDKPLTVLVNSYSASASEIFAAAIQDYNRGVVIGSKSTFGKGTVQRFFDLDRLLIDNYADYKPLGAVKMTIQKFYRIDGGSTQQKGVIPDVILPDQFSEIEVGESEKDNVMPWTEIEAVEFEDYSTMTGDVSELINASTKRVKMVNQFNLIAEQSKWLKQQREKSELPLNWEAYLKMDEEIKARNDEFEEQDIAIETMEIKNLAVDWKEIEGDEKKEERNAKWLEELNKDHYILESINILQDIIN